MKKGFTLVELLAVIVVIGIIATIGGIGVSSVLDASKEKSYDQQVNTIIKMAKEWGVEHTEFLPYSGSCLISIDTLVSDGKLETTPKNPKTDTDMTGGVEVSVEGEEGNEQYIYSYSYNATSTLTLCNTSSEE